MRVAIYIRVSTDEQADKGNSLTEQQERLSAYCVAMGWSDPTFFIDDGYSAKNLNRPAIKRLLDDVRENKFDIVLTSKLDRLCRNLLDLLQTIDLLNLHNCSYVSASESFDTSTAVGRMTLQLLGTFAEFERERISERVKDNMTSLAKNTSKAITQACYGYDIIDAMYVINDDEARHVRYMFELAEEGHGHRMIAKKLNDRGCTTKRGKMWDQTNVKRLMATETVAGIRVYNKRETRNGKVVMRPKSDWIITEGNHPAIIDPERFEQVQEIFRARGRAHRHADSETYLLTGLVICSHCGRNMKGSTSRNKNKYNEYTYYRYICSSYVLGYGCKHHAVHRDPMEASVIEEIERIATASLASLKLNIAVPSIEDELRILQDQLVRIDRRMQKQIDAYSNDLISDEDLKIASVTAAGERKQLRSQIETLESQSGNPANVQRNAREALKDIKGLDRVKAKAAMRILIERIEIADGETVSITWKG